MSAASSSGFWSAWLATSMPRNKCSSQQTQATVKYGQYGHTAHHLPFPSLSSPNHRVFDDTAQLYMGLTSEHLWESHVQMRFEIDSQPIFSAVWHVYLNHCSLKRYPVHSLSMLQPPTFPTNMFQPNHSHPAKIQWKWQATTIWFMSMCYLKQNIMWREIAFTCKRAPHSNATIHSWDASFRHTISYNQNVRDSWAETTLPDGNKKQDNGISHNVCFCQNTFGPWIGPWTQLSYVP